MFVISLPHPQPSRGQQVKSLLRGRGWISPPENELSFFDNLAVEHKIIDRYRPVEDKDVPDADVVIATWWETAEWVAKLSPSKGAKAYFIQGHEVFDYLPQARVNEYGDLSVSLVPPTVDTKQFYDPQSRAKQPRGKQLVPTVGT